MANPPSKRPVRNRIGQQKGEPGPVGPGNPPVHSRFQPGKSGNPKGRPPKERNLLKLIEAELDAEMTITDENGRQRLSKRQVLAKRMVHSALQGDPKAVNALVRLLGSAGDSSQAPTIGVDPAIIESFFERWMSGKGGA